MSTPTPPLTVRFGRLEQRGVLLGLSWPQLLLAGLAVVVATVALYGAGGAGLVSTAPLWGVLLVAGTVKVAGRPVTAWAPVAAGWHARRTTGGSREITAPVARTELRLPGVAGTLAVTRASELGAALVWDQRASTVTAIAKVRGSGFVLADPSVQEHRVATWGRVLAQLCHQPEVVRVQVLLRSVPASAGAAREWWRQNATSEGSLPSRVLSDLLDQADRDAVRHETLLVLAVRPPRGTRRSLSAQQAAQVENTLVAATHTLTGAEVHLDGWVDPQSLPGTLTRSYDPAAPEPATGAQSLVPTMGVAEAWDHVRTDTAVHATFWIAEWPRIPVQPTFLQPLVLGPAWRTFSLIAEPVPTGKALREIRRAHVEHAADAAHRARVGTVEDEAVRAERTDLATREAELVAGHGDLRFTGLITVTTTDVGSLTGACQAMRSAAAQSFCEVRPLVGQQAAAHLAGAVPLARGVR